jgi:hypothetical protein
MWDRKVRQVTARLHKHWNKVVSWSTYKNEEGDGFDRKVTVNLATDDGRDAVIGLTPQEARGLADLLYAEARKVDMMNNYRDGIAADPAEEIL